MDALKLPLTRLNQVDIDTDLPTSYKDLFVKFDVQECEGSGWVLDKILQIEVHTATLSPHASVILHRIVK